MNRRGRPPRHPPNMQAQPEPTPTVPPIVVATVPPVEPVTLPEGSSVATAELGTTPEAPIGARAQPARVSRSNLLPTPEGATAPVRATSPWQATPCTCLVQQWKITRAVIKNGKIWRVCDGCGARKEG